MFCENCGSKIPDTAKFCRFCGATQTSMDNADVSTFLSPSAQESASVGESEKQSLIDYLGALHTAEMGVIHPISLLHCWIRRKRTMCATIAPFGAPHLFKNLYRSAAISSLMRRKESEFVRNLLRNLPVPIGINRSTTAGAPKWQAYRCAKFITSSIKKRGLLPE